MGDILTYGQFIDFVNEHAGAFEVELYDQDGLRIDEGTDIPRFTRVIEHCCMGGEFWAVLDWTPPEGSMHNKCRRFKDIVIKPDGENELDPCRYEEVSRYENVTVFSRYENVTVSVLKCKRCGHVEVEWCKQPNTREIHFKNGEEENS